MTELLTKAFDEASKLPRARQDEMARRLLDDLIRENPRTQAQAGRPEGLEDGYREMAADREREAEAEEWAESRATECPARAPSPRSHSTP